MTLEREFAFAYYGISLTDEIEDAEIVVRMDVSDEYGS